MAGVFSFIAARRKALGYIVAAAAEYITQLLPQANEQNAQVLHGIVLALGFLLVYLPENVKQSVEANAPAINSFIDSIVRGEPKHAVSAPVAPAQEGPVVGTTPVAPSALQG